MRADVGELRVEVGDTDEELAHRADVSARVRAQPEEITEQVRQRYAEGRRLLAQKAPAVDRAIEQQPALVIGSVVAVLWLLVSRRKRCPGSEEAWQRQQYPFSPLGPCPRRRRRGRP